MSTEVWGNMPKSLEDAETPEQMAERVVQAHNDNADAHLEANQSLQSHRATEIIDHVARSIVGDKVNAIQDVMESADDGVVTGLTTDTLTDNTKEWVVNEWAGHWVIAYPDESGESALRVVSNTADTLTVDGDTGDYFSIGQAYLITNLKTNGAWDWTIHGLGAFNNRGITSNIADRNVEASLNGNQIAVIAEKGPDCGKVDIYIDDVLQDTVDLYSASKEGRIRIWESLFDIIDIRTVKVKIRSDKNASSTGYYCRLNGFDNNGVVSVASLDTAVMVVRVAMTTNSNGYAVQNIAVTAGYYILGLMGWDTSGHNSGAVTVPKIYTDFDHDPVQVIIDDGQASTSFTIKLWFLVARNDSFVEQ